MSTPRPALGILLGIVLCLLPGGAAATGSTRADDKAATSATVDSAEGATSKEASEASREEVEPAEGKRKQDLGRLLLLWFLRQHPLQ